jgi:hypothetical protein
MIPPTLKPIQPIVALCKVVSLQPVGGGGGEMAVSNAMKRQLLL